MAGDINSLNLLVFYKNGAISAHSESSKIRYYKPKINNVEDNFPK